MAETPETIADDIVVSLHYQVWLDETDELIEQTGADDPITYLHGHDNLVPGLESAIAGLQAGEERTVILEPDEAYGARQEDRVRTFPREELPADLELEFGTPLSIQDDQGNVYRANVVELGEGTVTLDFNHPLAGERLRFEVEVLELRQPTEEELAHGHVHDGHHHH